MLLCAATGWPAPRRRSRFQLRRAGPRHVQHRAAGWQIGRSVVQADGKLVVTGSRPTEVDNQPGAELFARRFNVDGSTDAGFGTNGESRFSVRGRDAINMITLDAEGRIVLAVSAQEPCTNIPFGGCFNSAGQVAPLVSAVVRLRTDGTPDPALGGKGYTEATDFYGAYAVAVQPDGKLLLLGTTGVARARIFNWNLARFNPTARAIRVSTAPERASRCDALALRCWCSRTAGSSSAATTACSTRTRR
jgi:uncharacterized delta-60 repeat protein